MTFQRSIYWRQGTFLEPQHFQLQELQRRSDLSFLAGRLQPYAWGVTRLEINEDPLLNFRFELIDLDLWLPDGRRLLFPENLQAPSRSFHKAWTNPDEPLPVCLAVPHFSPSGPNVNEAAFNGPYETDQNPSASFKTNIYNAAPDPELIPDLLGCGPGGRVETLYYNAYFLFGDEIKKAGDGVELIPLARLVREGDKIRFLSGYAPPSLVLYTGNPLNGIMADVLEIMRAKSRQLEDFKISPAQSLQNSLAADDPALSERDRRRKSEPDSAAGNGQTLLALLGILCRYIPRFHLLLAAPSLHPWNAFTALRELAGELTIFAPGLSPLGESLQGGGGEALRPYDHLDPFPAFNETKTMIARLLDSIAMGPEMTLIFKKDGRFFKLELPNWLDTSFICWLAVRSDLPKEQMIHSIASYGKLSPPDKMETLISYTLPGIALTPLTTPPVGLPRRGDTAYFGLRQSDPMWEEALKAKRLVFFWDSAPESGFLSLTGNRT